MTSNSPPGKKARRLTRKLRQLNICSTGRDTSNTLRTNSEAGTGHNISYTPHRPPRPVQPSELPPPEALVTWQQQQAVLESQRRKHMKNTNREHIARVGESARQRRMEKHVLNNSHIYQDVPPEAHDPGFGYGGSPSRRGRPSGPPPPYSPRRRGSNPTRAQHKTQRTTPNPPDRSYDEANEYSTSGGPAQTHVAEAIRDRASYRSSEYSIESPDKCKRTQRTRAASITTAVGYGSDDGEPCDESYNGEVSEASSVDVKRLYKMEAARRGFCLQCKSHTITLGTYYCPQCGQDFDCSSWEELDCSAELLKEPLRDPPHPTPPPLRSSPRKLIPPPPLSNRPLATLTPLKQRQDGTRDQSLRMGTFMDDIEQDSHLSPISPIRVGQVLPLPGPSRSGRAEQPTRDDQTREASQEEIKAMAGGMNPARHLRKNLMERGRAAEVGPPPTIYAVQELSKLPQGEEILRTAEVKSSKEKLVDVRKPQLGTLKAEPRVPFSKFHGPRAAEFVEDSSDSGDSGGWELDLLDMYEDTDVPAGQKAQPKPRERERQTRVPPVEPTSWL